MNSLGFIGKLLYALPMAMFGFFHFMNSEAMTGSVPGYLPFAIIWVYLTGVALILAAVAIIINKQAKLATLLLGIMLALFALMIHLPGFLEQDQVSSGMFLKDLALAGAAFFMSSRFEN